MEWHGKHNGTTLMGALHYLVPSMGPEGLSSHRHHIDVSLLVFCQWRDSVGLTVDSSIRRDGLLHDVERRLEQFYDGAIILK